MKIAAIMIAAVGTSAPIAPADFLTDWPKMVGQRATVMGTVYDATEASMLLEAPPETIRLMAPWVDREDLRYLLRYCIGEAAPRDKCTMPVTGTVRSVQGRVELYAVDFATPK